ncbi:MAG: hypothetical protein ACI4S4_07850, partial [Candidatus Ornithospirochaeta sp.]
CSHEDKKSAEFVQDVKNMIFASMQYETMMKLDSIISSLRWIGIPDNILSTIESEEMKSGMNDACHRRNQIVHQSDRKSPSSQIRSSLDKSMVEKDIKLIENLQETIHGLVKKHGNSQENA